MAGSKFPDQTPMYTRVVADLGRIVVRYTKRADANVGGRWRHRYPDGTIQPCA